MDDIAISVTSKVAECLVAPTARQLGYIWNYKSSFDNLETEVRKLKGRKETVQQSIVEARRQGDEIFDHVRDWLDRVQKMVDEASELVQVNEQANIKCFNPKKRYQHGRKAAKKVEAVARLYEEGEFDRISYRTIPKETWIPFYKGYEAFESRISTLKDILNALSDPNVNMVGIYGTGGIGKTMLAREVAAHAEDKKLFDVVAFAEVALQPDIKEMQQEIADKLGLTFLEESAAGRASKLRERLMKENKVLLVLDNIWERLDLEKVGIPSGNDHNGCKLLLTARSLDLLSNKMDSQNNFEIRVLDKQEAWSLFKKKAGACIENNDHLQALAIDVATACGGLPIAINTIAMALKNKEEFEWENALQELERPSSRNFEGVAAETYSIIEISYKQLKGEELKSTFLLCSIMGYTYIGDLLKCGVGLRIFKNIKTMEEARNRVNTLVQNLKDSSLLLDAKEERFSMHDVVRDVGRSIASRNRYALTVTDNDVQRDWDDEDTMKTFIGISLHNISKLPEELGCPHLKFLYMKTTGVALKIPDNFFTGMSDLRVVHLVGFDLLSLPTSIRLLVNLRTLNIVKCNVEDIALIGELKKLEIFSFRESFIKRLPEEICKLTKLRLLDLNGCSQLEVIPPNFISSLTQLEELYLDRTFINWEVEGRSNASLDELKHLSDLTALQIYIRDANVLRNGLFSKKLERYNIIVGARSWDYWFLFKPQETCRTLELNLGNNCSCFEDVLLKTPSVKNVISALDGGDGFPKLKQLGVHDSPCFHIVADCSESKSCNPFPSLETLVLDRLINLEKIYNGELGAESFYQLRTIIVEKCKKLKNIFSFSTTGALPLKEVKVSDCPSMTEIFAIGREEHKIQLKELRSITLAGLPQLTSFCSEVILEDSPLFNEKVALPSLEKIEIQRMVKLERIWHKQLAEGSFCNLKSMSISSCSKLVTIFRSNMLERILRLEFLNVSNCASVEQIFDLEEVNFEGLHLATITQLRELRIYNLPKLKHIWKNDPQGFFSYQNLKKVSVSRCQSLKYIFPASIATGLLQLEELDVDDCGVLEEIVVEGGEANAPARFVFAQMAFLTLRQLPQFRTFYSGVHTSEWPRLKGLKMSDCDKIELFALESFNFQGNNVVQQPLFRVDKDTFPCLEEMEISHLDNLKIIWHKSNQVAEDSFCNLKSMVVRHCNKLLTIFKFTSLGGFPGPELLNVSFCNSLERIFDIQGLNLEESHNSAAISQLRVVEICNLPNLKHILNIDPKGRLSFQKLQRLEVHYCKSLKCLFPASIATGLPQLEKLDITNCKLEEIVANKNQAEAIFTSFVFPKVTYLRLEKLSQLTTFYRGVHTSKWPALKELKVSHCDKIELLASELCGLNKGQPAQQPLFLVEKDSFPNLEELVLNGEAVKMISPLHFSEDLFCKLKFLGVHHDKSSQAFPLGILQKFHQLEILQLLNSWYEEILPYAELEKHPQIKSLRLGWLNKLEHIWKKDSKLDLILQNIEVLEVQHCLCLIDLAPSTATFHNLTTICVKNCQVLKNLVTSSTAKSLVQLTTIEISYCPSMTEVVANEGDIKEDEIIFNNLKSLTLDYLSSLTSFCSGNYTFKFPSLERLYVTYCHKMKTFSSKALSTPMLQNVSQSWRGDIWEGDLNATIRQIYRNENFMSSIEDCGETSVGDCAGPSVQHM